MWKHFSFGMRCIVCGVLEQGGYDKDGNYIDSWEKAKNPENAKGKGLKCKKCYERKT